MPKVPKNAAFEHYLGANRDTFCLFSAPFPAAPTAAALSNGSFPEAISSFHASIYHFLLDIFSCPIRKSLLQSL
ncbi:MAG: hypothetical protein PUF44_06220 [Bacteroidales bacterium]|nr:hypothetical protein [Bacteroidales bacterium]